jgi:hypothetical protein
MYKAYKLVLHQANGECQKVNFSAKESLVAEVAENYKKLFEKSITKFSYLFTSKITSYYYGEIEKFED